MQAEDKVNTGPDRAGFWSRRYLPTTVGLFTLAFLFAFEALAVGTVMPVVARELDGLSLYGLAFGAPMATAVVTIALAGGWTDARGPAPALRTGVVLFSVGILAAALAPSMVMLVLGRSLQGLGAGLAGVAMYVVIARAYPQSMRAKAFTVLSSGWVFPALVGPALAGWLNDLLGWRSVFGAAPLLAVAAYAGLAPVLRKLPGSKAWRPNYVRTAWAVLAAGGVLGIGLTGGDATGWALLPAAACAALVLLAGPRLLPRRTWTLGRGLPATILLRGFIGAAFAGAEAYLPLALSVHRGFTPTQAGLLLTVSAVTWFAGSLAAANLAVLANKVARVRLGALLMAVGIGATAWSVDPQMSILLPVLGWAVAGAGIGMAFPTLSVLMLDFSAEGEEGTNSSSLQVNDNLIQSLWLALGTVAFALMLPVAPLGAFIGAFASAAGLAAAALALSGLLAPRRPAQA
ncbi:MFS transporter [Arthrobacter sp. zg-Y238]|uniref:MFS transporter n=1 Tax=Arthrobacter sp. zg-Y238 TaxID=2964614 RepID=UPI0021064AED|nr:MFS transporter [Arthrobacter sp. zg-Y238]MCQ1954202.1 MFS transporter [Arthrobacter sp. zg-Y238]